VNLRIALIVGAFLLIGAGGLLFLNKSKISSPSSYSSPSPSAEQESKSSLLDILESGATQNCTFTYNDKGSKTEGSVYIEGTTKMRGDIKLTSSDNKVTNFSMIRVSDTTYVWGFQGNTGYKMSVSPKELSTNDYVKGYLNTDYKTDYKCENWNPDSSKFAVPTNVKFTDLTNLMKEVMPNSSPSSSSSPNTSYCSACNTMTGQAKTYCIAQYCAQ
jgi:hypothetical protein